MQTKRKGLSILLASTVALGALSVLPIGEVQAKAAISQQTKGTNLAEAKTASAGRTAKDTTSAVTNQAIATQLAAKGIDYNKLNKVQQQDTYVDVIVQMSAAPASENGTLKPDYSSTAEIQQATNQVIAAQASVKSAVEQVTHQTAGESYGYVVNGFTTKVKVADIPRLKQIPGVKTVTLAKVYYPTDAKANSMANVQAVWSNYKYKGEGTVVSVIDTGIDPNHKDMRLSDTKKAKLTRTDVEKFTSTAKHGRYFTAKVPYGFNYADNNDTITDDTVDEQHGMHVSGIIGANGTGDDPTKSVVGVAPESQLLAMKVFTNSDTSATTGSSTLVSAIEDSAKLGADVLNMSLGSVSGNQTLEDPEIAAVQNANESGTAAVISAGNSGTSGSGTEGVNKDYYGLQDNETVGTPGTSRGATTVASAENTDVINQAVTITDGSGLKLGPETVQLSSNDFVDSFDQKKFYVVKDASGKLSTGDAGDYTADAKGKIAIVKRGSLTFTDKQKYAEAAGAAGLIIVNNDGTSTPLTSISLTATFPTFGLSNTTGQKLVDWVTAHPNDSLGVKIALALLPNQNYKADRMSSFTSYGPVSDLSFKPDITAPGGNIWSTQNNNGYTNMSGTSMASPFIAGSQALLKQALNNKDNEFYADYKQLKGTALTDFLKTVEMNTAKPINDINYNNVIVSPRRQGAGLVDVKAAIDALEKNPSTVVSENGYPAVELKDFTSTTKTFKLTFTNRTKHQLTYQMTSNEDTNAVYTSATDPNSGVLYDKKITDAAVKPDTDIVVPAGKSVKVPFTLSLPKTFDQQQFVEGFLNFKGNDGSNLNLPYMGFFGDWNDGKIVDSLNGVTYDPTGGNYGTVPVLTNKKTGSQYYGGLVTDASGKQTVDDKAVAFSSDKNALYNDISMQYYLLRNISDVQVDVLDNHGNKVTTLSSTTNQTKTYYDSTGRNYTYYRAPAWDGTYYDQRDGNIKTAADGNYTYRISGVPEGGDKRQTYDVAFTLDSKAPTVRHVALTSRQEKGKTTYYLTAEAKDDRSGLDATKSAKTSVNQVTNLDGTFTTTGTTADGYTKLETPLTDKQAQALGQGDNNVELYLTDNASNATDQSASAQKPGSTAYDLIINGGGLPDKITSQTANYQAGKQGGTYTFTGTYPAAVYGTYTDAQGKQHDLTTTYDADANSFKATMALDASDYATKVDLYTDQAHTQLVKHFDTNVRLAAPTFSDLRVNDNQDQTSESTVKVTGTASADTEKVTVTNGGTTTPVTLDAKHHFSGDVPVNYGDNTITVTAEDEDGNTVTKQQKVNSTYDADVLKNAVTFDQGVTFGANQLKVKDAKYYDPKTGIATITGKVKHPTTTLQVDGKQVPIKDDLTFSFKLNLGTAGQKPFGVVIGDTTQDKTVQDSLTFILDAIAPTLSLDSSTDKPVYTNDPNFRITGTATDNVNYLELAINGSQVASQYEDINLNSGQPGHMAIDQTVKLLEGKNVLTVAATDSGSNVTTKKITVYYEPKKTLAAPTITPNTTDPAKEVTLTAKAAAGETVQYSTDGGKTYQDLPTTGLSVSANADFKFKAVDLYGNESPAVDYAVKNIKTDDPAQLQKATTTLQDLLTQAKAKAASAQYTDATTDALNTAIGSAQTALAKADATIETLTTATTQLTTAVNQLVDKLPADQQAALLNKIQSAKEAFGTDLGGQTDPSTGKTLNAELDAVAAQTTAGTSTADQIETNFNKVLDAALNQLAKTIKAATPVKVGNAKDTTTGKTWYGDVDAVIAAGTAAKADTEKIAQLQGLFGLKTKIAAAVEAAAKTPQQPGGGSGSGSDTGKGSGTGSGSEAGKGSGTGSGSEAGKGSGSGSGSEAGKGSGTGSGSEAGKGSGTGSGSEAGKGSDTGSGSDAGKGSGTDKGNQPKDTPSTNPKGGDDKKQTQETPAQPTGTENANSNGANSQASTKDTLPSTNESPRPALAFLGALVMGGLGLLGIKRKRKQS